MRNAFDGRAREGEGVISGSSGDSGAVVAHVSYINGEAMETAMTDIDTDAPMTGTPPEVMDTVMARHFEAEATHDRAGILATLTEDAEHEPVGFPGGDPEGDQRAQALFVPDGRASAGQCARRGQPTEESHD